MTQSAADVVHLLVAVALTYALGFERDLRGAPAGDRVFALIGAAAGLVGVFAVHGAPTALQGALTALAGTGRPVLGVVLNDEHPSPLARFSRYDYYHHGYWSDASMAESEYRTHALHNGVQG